MGNPLAPTACAQCWCRRRRPESGSGRSPSKQTPRAGKATLPAAVLWFGVWPIVVMTAFQIRCPESGPMVWIIELLKFSALLKLVRRATVKMMEDLAILRVDMGFQIAILLWAYL